MAKPELGTKRLCPACGTKYYDLHRDPITCPSCGTIFELAAHQRAAPVTAAAVVADEEAESEVALEREPDVISLEEAEEESDAEGVADAEEDETTLPDAENIDIDTEIETDSEPFLEEEEEEGDDVSGLLDVEGENEDEV